MKRRNFISKTMITGAILPAAAIIPSKHSSYQLSKEQTEISNIDSNENVVIERLLEGQPHKGKVLGVIQPHSDDIPFFAAGTVAKLIYEGYTGYLIRTSNDDAAGGGQSPGETVLNNEKDNEAVAKVLGLKKTYYLNYRNHRMDECNIQDIKGRLIFLFRLLKIDTLICYDPWGHYEENPDHYITARAVEAARWMAGGRYDYPEQLDVVEPHSVSERYYFARGPQLVNRVVDISKFIDKKVESNMMGKNQGFGNGGVETRKKLADMGKKVALFGSDDNTANFNYIKEFALDKDSENLRGVPSDRKVGEKYGLSWAERFHYIGPIPSVLDEFIKNNSVPK
ncbi:MAG: PIG-L family deacetylase [Ginsengibacter sp.]